MLIFIIGYMASGKTTLGLELAKHYNFDFLDLDAYIEIKEKKTIPEIFSLGGETLFRKLERKALKSVQRKKNIIISTGGGAPTYKDNMDIINDNGISLFLNVSVNEICKRLSSSTNKRPLIKGLSNDELEFYIKENLAKRIYFYKKANFTISSDEISIKNIVEVLDI